MTKQYERPDPSAPPENKYAPEYPVCLECGKEIEYAEVDEIVDCIDHLPIELLPEVCEVPKWLIREDWVERADYDRCKRALDRAVKAWKEINKAVRRAGSSSKSHW